MSRIFDELMQGLNEVEGFLEGNETGFRVHVPDTIDVKRIRTRLHMTQARFSDAFGFSLDAIKHWEGGRRTPEVSARAYLTVIAKNPEAVMHALGANSGFSKKPAPKTRSAGARKPMPRRLPRAATTGKKAFTLPA
ncbi:MAG TPA: hypothetical protein VGN16_16350 [Acidobacteriaceae bacterium]|jgi:putative transcriptional regulator